MSTVNQKDDCIFCAIASGAIASEKLYEDSASFVIRDIHPQAPIHLLVIPKQHTQAITELPTDVFTNLQPAIVAAVKTFDSKDGYRLVVNYGQNGGQEVPHVHIHVLAGEPIGPLREKGR